MIRFILIPCVGIIFATFLHIANGYCDEPRKLNVNEIILIQNSNFVKILPLCQVTVTSNFQAHLARSFSPGVDIDLNSACIETEDQFLKEIPEANVSVHSPVTGEVISHGPGQWGTIIVKDKNGYMHKLLHNQIVNESVTEIPFETNYIETLGVEVGKTVGKGQIIGYLGRTRSNRDHVHYSIYRDIGKNCVEFIDPLSLLFDPKTGAVTNQNSCNSCISCIREICVDDTVFTNSQNSSITIHGSFAPPSQKGTLCGKSIVRDVRWKHGNNTGAATTADHWKTWSAIISPSPKPGEIIEFTSYGFANKELHQFKYQKCPENLLPNTPEGFRTRIN